jgi:hypothetical protein
VTGTGTAEIDFGAWPGSNEASVTVAAVGVTATPATHVETWVMATDSTLDHTAADHKYFPSLAVLTAEAGADQFTVHGRSLHKMQGRWAFHYVWAN